MYGNRINWIDQARALSIILVVMMHSTLGVEKALGFEGWMHAIVSFATPFRIPAFFLISGLLLASALRKPLPEFLDKRVFTLLYLYAVWVTIQFALKAPGMVGDIGVSATVSNYLFAFVQPFGTLWFIYVLPLFFILARLTMGLPPLAVLGAAFIAHVAPVNTGWLVIDEVADCFFYFYLGHVAAQHLQQFSDWVVGNPRLALGGIGAWALAHGLLLPFATLPVIHVAFAVLGAAALIAFASLLRYLPGMALLRWVGRNTIVVYLGFFLPMAVTRTVLAETGLIADAGTIAVLTTIGAIIGAIIMFWCAKRIGLARAIYTKPGVIMSRRYIGFERRRAPRFRMIAGE